MSVPREVILDLLPAYLAGEASAATRALVEEHARHDDEIARRIRDHRAGALDHPALPPNLELRVLRRTRRTLFWQKWIFGFAITFTAFAFAVAIRFENGRIRDARFLLFDDPGVFGPFLVLAALCWGGYLLLRRRVRF